ncbi:uncharacterized protein MELLADRAFT_123271 [Melampsora larici-populina 98AG31]|uniref:Secreted protein n=1 Tax=Melampsora larici-populina (strain 98AG31 / pathotype 3-4-7) TaxID=747676 RepID=F4RUC9_MELLP|nr:uncharacterized protein MELLADRAFT_123271 [Melampsora larici-populina 98AG31]EGG04020.1 secreted protein [Melampsora larici-populina 98AG31]
MSRIPTYLFINLAILLVFLATLTSAGKCIICVYDGRAYVSNKAAFTADGLCYGGKAQMGSGCTGSDWNTGIKDHKYGGQKTFCKYWCPDTKTPCSGHTVTDINNPDEMVETLRAKYVIDCGYWPGS